MSRFDELNNNITYVTQELLKSQPLLKLISNNSATPLSSPDIINPSNLLFNRIYPLPKIPEAQEEQKSIINIVLSNASSRDNDIIKFKDSKLIFYIIVHINLWKISGGIRPLMISSEIDKIFNEKARSKLSIGKVLFDSWIYKEWNSNYCGYYLAYNLCDFN